MVNCFDTAMGRMINWIHASYAVCLCIVLYLFFRKLDKLFKKALGVKSSDFNNVSFDCYLVMNIYCSLKSFFIFTSLH
jgi:hypothetical protein